MTRIPRLLPLLGVAICGVLAINALAGARDLPGLISGARAFAEDAVKPSKGKAQADKAQADKAQADKARADKDGAAKAEVEAATGAAANTALSALPPPSIKPQAVCAPTAAELAKQAGLSPAELQVLQNLGARRGELDQREGALDTQLAVIAAAEAKVDAKLKALSALKADVQGLITQADGREAAEIDRLVKVFEGMKPKDAAPRMVLLDDSVRLPIAAKMKERSLSAIIAQMPPAEAKKLTEALARRFTAAQALAARAVEPEAAPAAQAAPAKPTPKPVRRAAAKPRKAAPRKAAPAAAQAAAKPVAKPAAPATPAAPAAPAPAAKSG